VICEQKDMSDNEAVILLRQIAGEQAGERREDLLQTLSKSPALSVLIDSIVQEFRADQERLLAAYQERKRHKSKDLH